MMATQETTRPTDQEAHRATILADLAPVGPLEIQLATRATDLLERLERVAAFEQTALQQGEHDAEQDCYHAECARLEAARAQLAPETARELRSPDHPADLRSELQWRGEALAVLQRLQPHAGEPGLPGATGLELLPAQTAATAIVDAAMLNACPPRVLGLPPINEWEEKQVAVHARDLWMLLERCAERSCLPALLHLAAADWTAAAMLRRAIEHEESRLRCARYNLEAADAATARLQARRVIPESAPLTRITLYERHLGQQLTVTLDLLHACQARRTAAG
jgi:hypothetical protein